MNKFLRTIKEIMRPIVPTFIRSLLRYGSNKKVNSNSYESRWEGDFNTWQEVEAITTGYDADSILQKVKESLLKVKNKQAAYERDSVLFDEIQYSWPLLATIQKIAVENENELALLDFGGSLGSSYFQNREFLGNEIKVDWNIVEQPHFVQEGQNTFESGELHFFLTAEQCLAEKKISTLLLSGVLQCLEAPLDWVAKFCDYGFEYIIVDRCSIHSLEKDRLTAQWVAPAIYEASYPCWFFGKERLVASFQEKYEMLFEFDPHAGYKIHFENSYGYFKGFVFRRRA